MIRAAIFDLDNCLAAADEVGEELYQPAFDAIRQANDGTISEETLQKAFTDCWRHPLDWVAARYAFSEAMLAAGWRVFINMKVTRPMHGYADLATLRQLSVQRFLVTSGFRRLQESKIKELHLETLFAAIHVDAIDEPDRLGKSALFQQILKEYNLAPAEVVIVGDNADSEIEAGNQLGLTTVQTLRPGVPRANNATLHIQSLAELKELLKRLPD
jgi:putative hydrolase of the HAD superfamily